MKVPRVIPVQVLEARAQARALLFRCCEYEDSGEAVWPLLAYAHEYGIEDEYGAEFVLSIIRNAFRETASIEI